MPGRVKARTAIVKEGENGTSVTWRSPGMDYTYFYR